MLDCLLDALFDTLKVFAFVLVVYFILSFVEGKLSKKVEKSSKSSPIIGAALGLIPQCGFSVVASDLYKKKYITMGTVLAVFIACSDEAIPILISNLSKAYMVIPLLATKFLIAITIGYLVDLIIKNQVLVKKHNHDNVLIHKGCCHHEIEEKEDETFVKKHIVHPLLHSLKITAYVLVINIIFALLIYFVSENSIINFLNQNVYLTPLFTCLVGLIPNCASSVIISELYVSRGLTFAATISGLICNAGLGLIYLYKDKNNIKNSLIITSILILTSLIFGYIILLIELNLF